MNAVAQHKTRHIVSEIDIQLWAREQRRRCFARTFGTPLRKLALGLRVRPAWWHGPALGVSFSLLPVEAIAASVRLLLATLPSRVCRWRNRPFGMLLTDLALRGDH